MSDGDAIARAVRLGQLRERIARQRRDLAEQLRPVAGALSVVDGAVTGLRQATAWIRRHPRAVLLGVAVFAALRPRRLWRWARRGLVAWRAWHALRGGLDRWLARLAGRPFGL